MRRFLGIALLGALAAAGWSAWRWVAGGFRLSGTVLASHRFQKRLETPNMVMFVTALNVGGVPVAVKKFVNPALPLDWKMAPEDMILPGRDWDGTLTVRVTVSPHGKVGEVRPGDLLGEHRHPVKSGDHSVDVVIDAEAPGAPAFARPGPPPSAAPQAPAAPEPVVPTTPPPPSAPPPNPTPAPQAPAAPAP